MTHLIEILRVAQPKLHGFERVVVWGGTSTLSVLDNQPWLDKRTYPALNKGLLRRTLWQRYGLSKAALDGGCDVLFVPGGSYAGNFHPVVTMSRNLLPFEMPELLRYGWSLFTLKLLLLRAIQSQSFRQADGVIFLTNYAREIVLKVTDKLRGQTCIIPHGYNSRFRIEPKLQRNIDEYNDAHPYRVLYVSIIDQYKHQWHVVEAVAALRQKGLPIVLDLVGPAYPPALKRLNQKIDLLDIDRRWVHYHGAIPFDELHLRYAEADLGLFASSCENMPNILLETMAAGLPVASSKNGPMPEILGDSGVFFNPTNFYDIATALERLIAHPRLRSALAEMSSFKVQKYSWETCADQTFAFLAKVNQSWAEQQ